MNDKQWLILKNTLFNILVELQQMNEHLGSAKTTTENIEQLVNNAQQHAQDAFYVAEMHSG